MAAALSTRPATSSFTSPTSVPGAWQSTWSLSEMAPVENTVPRGGKPHGSLSPTASIQGSERELPRSPTSDISTRASVVYDDASDDFYSFISATDDDADVTLLPGQDMMNITPLKHSGSDCDNINEGDDNLHDTSSILAPHLQLDHPSPTSSGSFEINSSLHRTTPEDTTLSDEASEELRVPIAIRPKSMTSATPMEAVAPGLTARRIFLQPLSAGDGQTPRTSIGSTLSGRFSSSASAAYGDEEDSDEDSTHSDEDSLNSAHVVNLNLDGQSESANISEESFSSSRMGDLPAPTRPLRIQQSEFDITQLAQPDGGASWTLSLDPALALNRFAQSESSATSVSSVSIESSPAAQPEEIYDHVETPDQLSPTRDAFSIHDEVSSRRGFDHSAIDLPVVGPSSSPYAASHPATASSLQTVQKKNVAQKTKGLFRKMKKLFTPKTKLSNKGIGYDANTPQSNTDLVPFPDSPSTRDFDSRASSSTRPWAMPRPFLRSFAKSSAPSITLSHAPGDPHYPNQHRPRASSVMQDERYTYEYHARPQTLEEIKSTKKKNRRFSLPTGFAGSASRAASRPGSRPGTSNGRNLVVLNEHQTRAPTSLRSEFGYHY